MIKRKIFYSVIQADGITGIRKQDGYELQIDGETFNAYHSMRDDRIYILDPKNGIALQIYDVDENEDELLLEIDLIEKAKESDVPVHRDDKLADTLSKLDIGDMIPPELYEVVAEILVFVDSMDKIRAKIKR